MDAKVLIFIFFNVLLNVYGQNTTNDENIETTTQPPPKIVPTIFDVFIKGPPGVGIPHKSSPPPPPLPPPLPGGLEQFPGNPHVGIIRINKVPSPGPEFVHQGISPNSINNQQQQQPQPQQPSSEQQSHLNPQQGLPPPPPLPQQTTAQQQTPAYLPNGYGLPYPYANTLPNQIPQFPYSHGIQNPNYSPYQGPPHDPNQKPVNNPGLDYQGNPVSNNINNNFYQRQPVSSYDRQITTGGTDSNNRQREGEPDLSTENIYTGAGQFPGQAFPVPFGPQQPPYPGFGNFGPTGQFPNFNPNFTGTSFGQNPNVNNNNNNNNNGNNNNNNGIGGFPASGFPDPRFNQGQVPTVGFYGPINGFGGNIPGRFTPPFGVTPLAGSNFNPQTTK